MQRAYQMTQVLQDVKYKSSVSQRVRTPRDHFIIRYDPPNPNTQDTIILFFQELFEQLETIMEVAQSIKVKEKLNTKNANFQAFKRAAISINYLTGLSLNIGESVHQRGILGTIAHWNEGPKNNS